MTVEFQAQKQLGPFTYDVEFSAADELVVLFGHSGAGKSLTLQFIAGLLRPDAGRIAIDGRVVFEADRCDLPPQARNVGYVVQDLALFQHMTVEENVAFGIPAHSDRRARLRELLALFGLTDLAARKPPTLSGGQQQRVALARALGRDSRLLLLDEPFSALDESLRAGLRRELLRLRRDLGLTILFVTHDLREAHLLADRIAVFDEGRLLQLAPPAEIFRRPLSRRVAELTGVANILDGRVREVAEGSVLVDVERLALHAETAAPGEFRAGQQVAVLIRAERVNLRRGHPSGAPNFLEADLVEEFAYGNTHTLRFAPAGAGPTLEVELAARPYEVLEVASRKRWLLELPPADIHVVPL